LENQRRWVFSELLRALARNTIANNIGPGDSFIAGDVLLEVETDKAQMDVEAQDDGKLAKIIVRLPLLQPEPNNFSHFKHRSKTEPKPSQ
jgi:hypothetical protein